jgi:cation/acetate symporter
MSAAMLVPLVSGDTLTIVLFLAVVALTLYITFWASRQSKTTTDYYAGGRSFSGFQNGLAVSGDYMSAASVLGISGAIAIYGYDGFLYSIGFLVAWLVALLLIAELLRNSGRFTMADQLAYRMRQTPVTSNKAFGRWGEVFGDDVVAAAMIDRLVHHADIVALKGDSYRLRNRDLGRVPTDATETE